MEDWEITTRYISAWNYQLLAIMFLLTMLILMALTRTLFTTVISLSCFILFIVLEFVSFKRQRELLQ